MYTGEIISPDMYYVAEHTSIVAYKGTPWPPGNLEVTYTYGTPPPAAGRLAAKILATEFINYWDGNDCALPDRVTSITRQGVSYTILDNQDFLENMRTGIYAVDLFLKTSNPTGALAPSRVFSPDIPRARRAAPARPLVLSASATYDATLTSANDFTVLQTHTLTGGLAGLAAYNTNAYTLRLDASSWDGYVTKTYADTAAAFRVVGQTTYLDLAFDYNTTYRAIGPGDPGTWTLSAVNSQGASIDLLTGNLQIKKVLQSEITTASVSSSTPTKLICKQGETFTRTVTWSIDGSAVNLANYTAAMQVKSSYTSNTAILTLTSTPAAGITLGGAAGTITLTISAADTADLAVGTYVYDLELTSDDDTVTRLLEGQFVVTPEVTTV
jgi:hypothetical protein